MEKFGTFGQLKYERPDFEALKAFYEKLIGKVKNAKTYEAVKICMREEEEYSSRVSTMCTIASIRHTVDTSDKFYEEEDKYLNRQYPEAMPYMQGFSLALLDSPFKREIDAEYGEFFLKNIKLGVDSFSEKNIQLMQEENELVDRYQRIMASCKISFEGEECNLYGIKKYFSSPDRNIRKAAWKKYRNFSLPTKRRWAKFSTSSSKFAIKWAKTWALKILSSSVICSRAVWITTKKT